MNQSECDQCYALLPRKESKRRCRNVAQRNSKFCHQHKGWKGPIFVEKENVEGPPPSKHKNEITERTSSKDILNALQRMESRLNQQQLQLQQMVEALTNKDLESHSVLLKIEEIAKQLKKY